MDPKGLLRSIHEYSEEDFKATWNTVREYALIETMDDKGKPQGEAIVQVQQLYKPDGDGAFGLVNYVACSDEYYEWWTKNEFRMDTHHHFCRTSSLKACESKVGKQGVIHVLRWTPLTKSEAERILREWGFSPVLLAKLACPAPAGTPALPATGAPSSKSTPAGLPRGLRRQAEEAGEDKEHARKKTRRRHGEGHDRPEDEKEALDEEPRTRHVHVRPVTPPIRRPLLHRLGGLGSTRRRQP